MMRSHKSSTRSSCLTMTAALPRERTSEASISTTALPRVASRLAVGSSAKITSGSFITRGRSRPAGAPRRTACLDNGEADASARPRSEAATPFVPLPFFPVVQASLSASADPALSNTAPDSRIETRIRYAQWRTRFRRRPYVLAMSEPLIRMRPLVGVRSAPAID